MAIDLSIDVAWGQTRGDRAAQEDSAAITRWDNGFHLLLLADGMGGHVGGAEASRITVEAMKQGFIAAERQPLRQRLLTALQTANDAVFDFGQEHPELSGYGSTLVAATFDGEAVEWISVGDSPLWLIRQGTITRVNRNHSMAGLLDEQAARHEISVEEAQASPRRSELLEAVMGEDIELVDQSEEPLRIEPEDTLVLASDGVESLALEAIAELAAGTASDAATQRVDRILAAIRDLGRAQQDNATVVLCAFSTAMSPAPSSAIRGQLS